MLALKVRFVGVFIYQDGKAAHGPSKDAKTDLN